ncbi:hypothetical protein [Acinetobacter chinensis]|uniref:hypothetical protein n=1 Tax=Acinetobacter chinensis TaxID=2004650 RepID=UPI0029344A95|nr:hypothetical protein [Acinetobacter chinensis]WOE40070.1 hypothetical protein QSG87_09105 [Acinetobacter chinensis]
MSSQSDFEARLVATLEDYEIRERYNAEDPMVVQQLRSIGAFLSLMSSEIDIAELEPFMKTRDRSIIADATNKGILPTGTASQHVLEVINRGTAAVTFSQGREIEDHSNGRPWRLMQSVTVEPGTTAEVHVEQSEYREIPYTVQADESFHKVIINLRDGLSLAGLTVKDDTGHAYSLKVRWMNVEPLEYAYNLTTDSRRRVFIEFGDDERAGRTVRANQVYKIGITETYGEVDSQRLKDAAFSEVLNSDEQRVSIRFKSAGVLKQGTDPLSVSLLRVLASYPALYDEDAVFLGNFDYSVRKKFMARAHYIAVWNENEQDRYFGVTWKDINHLHIAVLAKNEAEQENLETEMCQYIGMLDSLYKDRVRVHEVIEKPFNITLNCRLAAVHDSDSVKSQIKRLLSDIYGQKRIRSSRWLLNGFNTQEISTKLKSSIVAFQDNISDFSIVVEATLNKPTEWVFITDESITVNIERTAEMGAAWIL